MQGRVCQSLLRILCTKKLWGGVQDQSYAKGLRRADMDLLLDVLDDRPIRWQEQRDQLAALFQ